MTNDIAEEMYWRMTGIGRSKPAIMTIISRRAQGVARVVGVDRRQRAFVAGVHGLEHVERLAPRTSPMMMRSGRIRKLLRTRSRCLTSPMPSRFGGRVSRRTTCGCCSFNSAESSMVTRRSSGGDEARQGVKQRRLAAAGAAGDHDADAGLDAGAEQHEKLRRHRAVG